MSKTLGCYHVSNATNIDYTLTIPWEIFVKRRHDAVVQGIKEKAVPSEFVDVPTSPDNLPSDGQTESMSPQFLELQERRFLDKRAHVE